VEVTPAGRDHQADETDREREPADDLSGTAPERHQAADEERETADGTDRLPHLSQPDARVSLDRDCECERGPIIAGGRSLSPHSLGLLKIEEA